MSSSTIIDQSMATYLESGSVSALSFGNKTVNLLLSTISLGLMSAAFPHFSRLVVAADWHGIEQTLKSLVKLIIVTIVPLIVVLIVFSKAIIALLFQGEAMTSSEVGEISVVQIYYLLQVPFYLVGTLGARLLNAMGGNRVLLRNAAVNVVCNVVGNLVFMRG